MMKLLSGTEHGQGILLICHKQNHDKKELLRPLDGYYVVLDSVQDPGNMGTIVRTSAAAGVKGLILTEGCTDIYAEKWYGVPWDLSSACPYTKGWTFPF